MWVQKVYVCGESLVVAIRREIADELGIRKGDHVKIYVKDGKIVIEPLKL